MSAVDERSLIGQHFKTGWANRLPVAWPNTKFEPPETSWVRFEIVQADADRIEFGGTVSTRRAEGRVFVQVFVPLGTGDAEARAHCDAVAAIFKANNGQQSSTDGRVIFREPVVRGIGTSGAHYQTNVSIPYQYDSL